MVNVTTCSASKPGFRSCSCSKVRIRRSRSRQQKRTQCDLHQYQYLTATPGAARSHAAQDAIETDSRSGDRGCEGKHKNGPDRNSQGE